VTQKILIVEDDPSILRALTIRLKANGFEVSVAHDGLSGMQAAALEEPDLVLLDISMPAGDGFTLAERMQDHPPTAGTPFIFMTASMRPDLRQRARAVGAAGFIQKPFVTAELLSAVQNALAPIPKKVV